ncbi:MAG: NAD-dependent epimerase/dehydratase family protein [Bacteroidota bacterium]|nr:NAD-dependent epimerase/dehydratase family protein [Bacteroidota bacterium]
MIPRILVTGGSGLLGSHLLRWFLQNGYSNLTATYQHDEKVIPSDLREGIVWKKLRLPDIADAFEVIQDQDWVIHSAGLVSYFKEDKFKLLDVNQKGTEHIVNACLAHDVKHLVYIGSIGALGKEKNNVTLNESGDWIENQFSTTYGLSKYLGELEVWRGAAEGLPVSVVLPSVILGTGDWSRSSLQLIDRIATKSPWYPGGQTGFVDVQDIVSFLSVLLEKSITGHRWLLSGGNMTYKEIYSQIASALQINRSYTLAPRWLASIQLLAANILHGRYSTPDILHQVYGTFSYDNTKSLGVEGFTYRPLSDSIRDMAAAYHNKK